MSASAREIRFFWKAASALAQGLREGVVGVASSDLYDDIEGVAFTTDNPVLKARADALLEARDPDAERPIVREPFHDDLSVTIEHFACHTGHAVPTVVLNVCKSGS